jgi:SAM-dependent methyltransferase
MVNSVDPSATVAAVQQQAAYSTEAALYQARTQLLHHWRRRAVELLDLRRGDVVLDVGCGTGLCFDLLQERVGPGGKVVGVDASTAMLDLARRRVAEHGWHNVVLVEAAAEDASVRFPVDAVLFCAVHDVLQSPTALSAVLACARPGARVAAVGGKWAPAWAVGLNAMTRVVHAPFVRDFAGFDEPWALLAGRMRALQVREIELGCGYLASGVVRADRADEWARAV